MRAEASPKAPSTKRGLAERSEVWGSLRELLPPDRRWRFSPLYEEGGFFRCGGVRAEQSPAPTGTSEVQRSTFVTVRAMFSHGPEPCAQARTRPFGGRPFLRPGACRMGGVYSCWPQPLS